MSNEYYDEYGKIVRIRKDLVGKIFGRLTVISFHHRQWKGKRSLIFYFCKCACGNTKSIAASSLTRGLTASCGCYGREQVSKSGKLRRTNGKLMSAKQMWKNSYNDGCSFELFIKLSQNQCHYCGSLPSNKYNIYINAKGKIKQKLSKEWADQSWFEYNGLDRLDSNLPHIETNIVACCKICNYAKRSMAISEFRE
jgi:hypothetical protein